MIKTDADERYAIIVKVRMQVNGFTSNPELINQNYAFLVDMQTHPQKDQVQEDWFYNAEDNTFSPEGEVHYPEPVAPQPTQLDRMEAALQKNYAQARQDGADAITQELQ